MKSIILFRHGESDFNLDFNQDHERPLTLSGIKDVGKMGKYLAQKNELPNLVISSTAVRAKTTAEIAMDIGKWPCNIVLESKIYGGKPKFLLNLIQNQDNKLLSICLVGHEPNFSRFIAESTDSDYLQFPTATMAKINFDVNSWKKITMGFGNLIWIVSPKEL